MATLAQLPRKYLENLLTTNKSAQYFPLGVSDYPFSTYPQGVPRSAVVSAYLTAAMQYGNFTFNLLGEDTFQRANENPLSQGGNWANTGDDPIQLSSGQACPSDTVPSNDAIYLGAALPPNQWASVTIGQFINGVLVGDVSNLYTPVVEFGLRCQGGAFGGYAFEIEADSVAIGNLNTDTDVASANLASPVVTTGDVFLAAAVGSTLLLYRNGVLVCNGSDSNLVGGYAGLRFVGAGGSILPINFSAISNFSCGEVVGAPNLNIS